MRIHNPVVPLMLALLSGCSLVPGYHQPSLSVSSIWPFGAGEEQASGPSVAELGWRDFFKSAELQALIQKGLENNRDLRVAALNIEAARAQYRVARADLLPSVSSNGSMTRQRTAATTSATGAASTGSSYSANVDAAWEIDLFGRLRSLNQAALEDYFATEEARNSVQISLVAEIGNAYLQLLSDRAQQQLAQQTLAAQQDSYNISERRFNEGIGSSLDLSQARTLLETARVDSIAYTRVVQQDRNAIDLLAGAQVTDAEVAGTFEQANQFVSAIQPGLPSDLLLNRPDVREAEHTLKGANANIGAARAAFFPTISLTALGGTAGTELSQLFGSGSGLWSFSPQISLPIFAGGRNTANLDLIEVRKNIAVAQYEKSVQVAFRDVADALVARATLDDELKAQEQLVKANDDSYRLAQIRYEQGISGYLDVLDARRNTYAAQQQLISRRLAMLQNYISLYTALGGGQVEKVAANTVVAPAKPAN